MIKFTQLDTFTKCLTILANADFKMAESNDIYRTGIIGQFNLTFELAWKALQEIMRMHSVIEPPVGETAPAAICVLPIGIAESDPIHPQKKAFEERAWFNSYNQSN